MRPTQCFPSSDTLPILRPSAAALGITQPSSLCLSVLLPESGSADHSLTALAMLCQAHYLNGFEALKLMAQVVAAAAVAEVPTGEAVAVPVRER